MQPLLTIEHLTKVFPGQVALDDVWSAMRFRALRPGEAPFTGASKGDMS